MKKIYFLFILALLPITASAITVDINGIMYILNSSKKTATVTKYYDPVDTRDCIYTGDFVIPRSVTYKGVTYKVNAIGDYAFENSGVSSVTIPNSVTSIGNSAFGGDCLRMRSLTIPSSVTSIGDALFRTNRLSSIIVATGNTHYDSRNNCNAIIESSTDKLILGCKYTIIPDDVKSIGNDAFYGCGLTSINIPHNVTSIGRSAFFGCGLTSIVIPKSVISIGEQSFSSYNLNSIVVETGNTQYDSRNNCNAIIETYTNKLIFGCKNTIIPTSVKSIGKYAFQSCSNLTSLIIPINVINIAEDAFNDCSNLKLVLPQTTYENSVISSRTKFTTYSKDPVWVEITAKSATTATMRVYPFNEQGNMDENTYFTLKMQGLAPGQNIKWKLDDKNYGIVSEKTTELTLSTQPAKPTSTTKARLLANVNEADDNVHFGFEWLRNDAPSNMPANKVSAPLYNGQIIGSLSNLNPDIYYKYRPFYQSESGEMFYGEWIAFLTGDANVFFKAEAHTREAEMVTEDGAQLVGVWIEGTEDMIEKGFEYWTVSKVNTRAVGSDVKIVTVNGNQSSIIIDDLVAGKEYGYRTYVKTASGTTYGEEKTFKTPLLGDANNDGKVNVADIVEITNARAGNSSASFNMTNADMDGNGSLTEADINAIVNKIMQK